MRSLPVCFLLSGASLIGYCIAHKFIDTSNSPLALWQGRTSVCYWFLQWLPLDPKCPSFKLLLAAFLTVPIYNVVLFIIGWQLYYNGSHRAQLLLAPPVPTVLVPSKTKRAAPPPPPALPEPPAQCSPAPRLEEQKPAPKPTPPPRTKRARKLINSPDIQASASVSSVSSLQRQREQTRQFKTLRRNLIKVLADLQQEPPIYTDTVSITATADPITPIVPTVPPVSAPLPVASVDEPIEPEPTIEPPPKLTKSMGKSSKFLRAFIKRLKLHLPFGKPTIKPQCNNRSSQSCPFPFCERLKENRQPRLEIEDKKLSVNSSYSTSSFESSVSHTSCFYV